MSKKRKKSVPKDASELDLVRLAIKEAQTTTGCCEWHQREAMRLMQQGLGVPGLTLAGIRELLIDFVVNNGLIEQRDEKRPHYSDRPFWYRAVIPVPGLPEGLFVEIVMAVPDPDCPAVLIVNAHS